MVAQYTVILKLRRTPASYMTAFRGELVVVKESHEIHTDGETEHRGLVSCHNNYFHNALMLGLDLPPTPLFKDAMEKNIIPQVSLFNILKKFDGETVTEVVRPPTIERKRFRITRLPLYLILQMQRFTKICGEESRVKIYEEQQLCEESYPSQLSCQELELKDYIPLPTPNGNERLSSKYDLIGNIVHDGEPGEGSYRVFVHQKSEGPWYEMQDLHVSETLPQMLVLSEAYMQSRYMSSNSKIGETKERDSF